MQVGVWLLQLDDVSHVADSSPYRECKGCKHLNVAVVSAGYLPSSAGSLSKLTIPFPSLRGEQDATKIFLQTHLHFYLLKKQKAQSLCENVISLPVQVGVW